MTEKKEKKEEVDERGEKKHDGMDRKNETERKEKESPCNQRVARRKAATRSTCWHLIRKKDGKERNGEKEERADSSGAFLPFPMFSLVRTRFFAVLRVASAGYRFPPSLLLAFDPH